MAYLLALTLLLAPAYAFKFSIGPLPTNLLMLWVFFVWLVFSVIIIAKKQIPQILATSRILDRKIFILTGLFFLGGAISLFWKGFSVQKLGQFVVLFLQPISIFFLSIFVWRRNPESKLLLLTTGYLLLALMGIYSIVQYFTLWGLPPAYWGNSVEPKRALSFFSHPNFYSLFSAPLLSLLLPDVARRFIGLISKPINRHATLRDFTSLLAWLFGTIGLLLSFSRAGWLGLTAAGLVYLFFSADKKIRKFASVIIVIIIIVIAATPNLRWRLITPFKGERSANSRIILWESGLKAIKTSPILGLGLNGYSSNYQKFQNDVALDTHNFPHNIFLNFWLETGITGLISLIGLIGLLIYRGLKNKDDEYRLGVALFLIAILSQGLLDNPYFKNDLALIFWLVLSLSHGYSNKKT